MSVRLVRNWHNSAYFTYLFASFGIQQYIVIQVVIHIKCSMNLHTFYNDRLDSWTITAPSLMAKTAHSGTEFAQNRRR